MFFYDNRVD